MATAAPSAPAATGTPAAAKPASTEAGQPAAQPTILHPGEAPPDAVSTPESQDPKVAKPIKPIKPVRAKLPGVDDFTPDLPPTPPKVSGRARGPNGQFTAPDSDAAPADPNAAPEEAAPVPLAKVKIGDAEVELPAPAAQNIRTLQGMHKANLAKIAELSAAASRAQAAQDNAWGWHNHAKALEARIAELERGGSGAPPKTAAAGEDPSAPQGIDWEYYRELQAVAAEKGHPELAAKWLADETNRIIEERINKTLEEKLRPHEEARLRGQIEQGADQLITQVASLKFEDGSDAFPELQDEGTVFSIGRFWKDGGRDPRQLFTRQGLMDAVYLYRRAYGEPNRAASAAPTTTSAASPSAAAPAAPSPEQLADTGLDAGGPPFDRGPIASNAPPELTKVLKAFTPSPRNAALGFDR